MNNPWEPFQTLHDFKLARWFIQSKVPRSRIDEYFATGLSTSRLPSFSSAYKLEQCLNVVDPFREFLQWNEGTVHDGEQSSIFFYRDIIGCIQYLLAQVAYKEDMVYAPIRETDSQGDRLYSEMHTADWWWEMQVNYSSHDLIL